MSLSRRRLVSSRDRRHVNNIARHIALSHRKAGNTNNKIGEVMPGDRRFWATSYIGYGIGAPAEYQCLLLHVLYSSVVS